MRNTPELECNLGHKDKHKCWYLNNPTNIQNYKSCWECPFHGKVKESESQPEVIKDTKEDRIQYTLNPELFSDCSITIDGISPEEAWKMIREIDSTLKGAPINNEPK